MKVSLFPFQKRALENLRVTAEEAIRSYQRTHIPQVISLTAPTGAGKTIIISSFIENIYFGDEKYMENPEAIFVWLSDSPELNEQSKLKIDFKADKIPIGATITINDDNFDQEYLEDGHIYFLNTQKLGKSSNLTKYSDKRQFTIWDTLKNTVLEKHNRLYFIIDEAHRGMQGKEAGKANTIMQKFLKGSELDNLPVMPVVIGMSATSKRFNSLIEGTTSTIYKVIVTADEVRSSGLLKDRIVISYSEETSVNKEMAVLQAAADEWKNKCEHWYQYCYEQHYTHVNPIFVIQVENGTSSEISKTDLDNCLRKIEMRTATKFSRGEVVHTFGQTESDLDIAGLEVPYIEPSRISDNKKIKIVFFKENLSTGWDCPRAETMMSFRKAKDSTYIAQLLGRMVRTPMQMSIQVDESLNDVHLFLPYFKKDTVEEVVKALQSAEGGEIPTDIEEESIENKDIEQLTIRPNYRKRNSDKKNIDGQLSIFDSTAESIDISNSPTLNKEQVQINNEVSSHSESLEIDNEIFTKQQNNSEESDKKFTGTNIEYSYEDKIDREKVVKAINDSGLLNYTVRSIQINNYFKSLFSLSRLLVQTGLDISAIENVQNEVVILIHNYIEKLKSEKIYDELLEKAKEFKLSSRIYDAYGESVDNQLDIFQDSFITTDADIDRQFRLAETKLGNEGISQKYVSSYYDNNEIDNLKLEVILFVASENFGEALHTFAKTRFHQLNDKYRRYMVKQHDRFQTQYDKIVSDGDVVSKNNFRLPETISSTNDKGGTRYSNHLFVNDEGFATIKLNSWEEDVLKEEFKRDDFITWIRNPSRGTWALRIPYRIDGIFKPAYPDFIIIREDPINKEEIIVDLLEPHHPELRDNLAKAKGFAEYARQNPGVGRIELIRKMKDISGKPRLKRLNLSLSSVRDKISQVQSNEELTKLFETDGKFY